MCPPPECRGGSLAGLTLNSSSVIESKTEPGPLACELSPTGSGALLNIDLVRKWQTEQLAMGPWTVPEATPPQQHHLDTVPLRHDCRAPAAPSKGRAPWTVGGSLAVVEKLKALRSGRKLSVFTSF